MTALDYTIVGAFLVAMAAAGVTLSRFIRTSDDFFVAGRQLTPFILCATITATNISMLHFIGMGGTAYQSGVSIAWQNWTGCMALVLSGIFVLPILRRLGIRSIPEFLEMRYSPGLRRLVGAFWGLKLCVFLGILLYVAATAAVVITGVADTTRNYCLWLGAFSALSLFFSAVGGAWAVAIMDSVQFVVLLAGLLVVLPIATHAAGGMPAVIHYFQSTGQSGHLDFVPAAGEFNWLFICAITLLSVKWATVEQTILQRALGARNPRAGAQGMVLSAIITVPFVFFWILPGLSAARLKPGFANPDLAMPWLLATVIPPAGRGLLGVVLCGLVAAQVSNLTSDVNSVATLFTSDLYRGLRSRPPSQRELLLVVRFSSLACGAIMLAVAWLVHHTGAGAVRANLAVVGIIDMPIFVVTILYGLLWKRANWQGAVAGMALGGAVGVFAHALVTPIYFHDFLHPAAAHVSAGFAGVLSRWHEDLKGQAKSIRNIVPILSSAIALVVTPVVSLLTATGRGGDRRIWQAMGAKGSGAPGDVGFKRVGFEAVVPEERRHRAVAEGVANADGVAVLPEAPSADTASAGAASADTFQIIPASRVGRAGAALALLGFAAFLGGVLSAAWKFPYATPIAVAGMLVVFCGGLLRVYSE